jgi:hypothetical protein
VQPWAGGRARVSVATRKLLAQAGPSAVFGSRPRLCSQAQDSHNSDFSPASGTLPVARKGLIRRSTSRRIREVRLEGHLGLVPNISGYMQSLLLRDAGMPARAQDDSALPKWRRLSSLSPAEGRDRGEESGASMIARSCSCLDDA